jgi:quercetin dioxygenase-like cupin family protein
MLTKKIALVFAFAATVAVASSAQTPAKKGSAMGAGAPTLPGSEQWMDIPAPAMVGTPSVPVGGTLKVAILQGDPMTAGRSYVVRVSCTDGSKVAPHTHPATENVTVIKGTFLMGMGSKWDDAQLKELPAGSFGSMVPKMTHFAQCKGDSIVQINGIAPLQFIFVGPNDAPATTRH